MRINADVMQSSWYCVYQRCKAHCRVKATGHKLWKDTNEDTNFHDCASFAEPGDSPAVLSMLLNDDLIGNIRCIQLSGT